MALFNANFTLDLSSNSNDSLKSVMYDQSSIKLQQLN